MEKNIIIFDILLFSANLAKRKIGITIWGMWPPTWLKEYHEVFQLKCYLLGVQDPDYPPSNNIEVNGVSNKKIIIFGWWPSYWLYQYKYIYEIPPNKRKIMAFWNSKIFGDSKSTL